MKTSSSRNLRRLAGENHSRVRYMCISHMVQWLGFLAFTQAARVGFPVWEGLFNFCVVNGRLVMLLSSATSQWNFISFTLQLMFGCSKVISTFSQPWHVRRETEIPCKAPSIYFEKRTLLLGSSSLITSAAGGHGNLRFFSVLQFFLNIGQNSPGMDIHRSKWVHFPKRSQLGERR